jgi:DNA-binding MarR family transcriptional regulator
VTPRTGTTAKKAIVTPQKKRAAGVATNDDCDPRQCPCVDADCSLSRYVRAAAAAGEETSSGEYTLEATERAVADRLGTMTVNMQAMAAVSNIYRAANAVRNHVERTVLAKYELTWTAWVVLWVIWIWGEIESRHVAAEAGISKGTLTGVQNTLLSKGLVQRTVPADDRRRVLLSLTASGQDLMAELFPQFNAEESLVTGDLAEAEVLQLARSLRVVVKRAENA